VYAIEVRDHIMIAHSFKGEVFGPAQALHGATFVVDATFAAETLDENGIVIDIGLLRTVLRETLAPLDYQNLDEVPALAGQNTTTELLSRWIHEALGRASGPKECPDLAARSGRRATPWRSPQRARDAPSASYGCRQRGRPPAPRP